MTARALRPARARRGVGWPLAVGAAVVVGFVALSLGTGVYDVGGEGGREMLAITRVPRTIALVLAGAALSLCGLIMQLMTQNRFVEPGTAGTTEWAGLGLLTTMLLVPGAGILGRMVGAVLFAFLGTGVFFLLLRRIRLTSSLLVPIVGIMLGAVVGAASTFLAIETDMLQQVGAWFAGSFTPVVRGRYELLFLVLAVTAAAWAVADRFTLAGLGRDVATGLGVNYEAVVLTGVAMVAVATGVVTVVVGALPFVGLVVPNLVSLVRGDDLRSNLPWVVMAGVAVVIACDVLGRTLIAPFEVPISLILGVVGAAVFLVLLLRQARHA